MLREPFPPRSRATLISDSLVGDWWAICLDTLFGQLVNIISTHISPHHHNVTWRTATLCSRDQVRMLRALAHCLIPIPRLHTLKKNALAATMEVTEVALDPPHTFENLTPAPRLCWNCQDFL